ncbi:unnamed protein product [Ectocarpus sp. 12 AP-2014]
MYSPGSDKGGFKEEEPSSRVVEGSETPKGTTLPSIRADPENASTLTAGGRSSGVGGWSSFKDNSSTIAGSKGRDDGGGDDWTLTMKLLKEGSSAGTERQRAYSLFEHLDVTCSHRIYAWELARFFPSAIGCTTDNVVEIAFSCNTLGLTVEEDEEGMVVVAGWEEDSAAAEHPSLMIGMRILSIDGWDLPCALTAAASRHGDPGRDGRFKSSLRKCESVLEALSDGNMEDGENALHVLEVAMPAIVVTKSNTWLDMDVSGVAVAVSVPLGVYNTIGAYFMALQEAGRDQHPTELRHFGVKFDPAQPFVMLTAGYAPFRILWRSGEHSSQSCRKLLHSSAEQDTDMRMSHTSGRWDSLTIEGTKQRLNLKPGALTDFAEHLILEARDIGENVTSVTSRDDGSSTSVGVEGVSLEYEEFCTLYNMYLSTQEGLWRARDLLMTGFLRKEEYESMLERQAVDDQRRRRLRKMLKTRRENKERKRQQLARRIAKWTQSNQAPQGSSTTGAEPWTAVATTTPASDDDGSSGGGIVTAPADGVEERGAVCDTESMGGAGKRTRRRRKRQPRRQVDYPEEALAERMAHLLSQRQVAMRNRTKAIKRAQQKAIKAKLAETMYETKKFEKELGGAGQWGSSKRSVELAKLGLEDYHHQCSLVQVGKRPHPEDIHPAFLGYFHQRRSPKGAWDPALRSPVFFGKLSEALTRREAVRGEGNLAALKALMGGGSFDRRSSEEESVGQNTSSPSSTCQTFPLAPSTRGKVRQRLREVGTTYDSAGLVHPSCFGLMTIPDDQDSRHQSPVFFGYDLVKKPRSRGGALEDHEKPKREDFVVHRKGKSCPVCLVGKPGCPCCWDFPEGYVPHDFAYLGPFEDTSASRLTSRRSSSRSTVDGGGSVSSLPPVGDKIVSTPRTPVAAAAADRVETGAAASGSPAGRRVSLLMEGMHGVITTDKGEGADSEEKEKPELHTDLTTSAAITLYRSIVGSIIRIFVKVIPCGTATCLWMDSSWPVSYLFDLWRANAAEGCTIDAFMCLPTIPGLWNLDNRNLPETDTTLGVHTGNLPLSTYNLTTPKSTVTVLCTTFLSKIKTRENIERYLVYETGLGKQAVLEVFDHLVGCPKHPENDPIQKVLCGLMEHRVAQQQLVDNDDDSAEVAKRNRLLLDAEKTRKQTALEKKRGQVAYGSKEWKTEQRTLRQKEAEAAFLLAGGESNPAHSIVTPNVGGVKADERGDVGGGLARGAAAAIGGKLSKLNLSFRASAKKLF